MENLLDNTWDVPPDKPLKIIDPSNPTPITICVDDIILLDPSKHDTYDLLQHESTIAHFIQVLVSKSDYSTENLGNIREYFQWLSMCSENLALRIGQQIVIPTNKTSTIRSSYNFCTSSASCSKFYNLNNAPTCTEHHYVHSQLKFNIDSIINYIDYCLVTDTDINNDDLVLSVKTICYVTRHMAKEINYIHFITKGCSERYHRCNDQKISKPKKIKKHKKEVPEPVIPTQQVTNRYLPLFR